MHAFVFSPANGAVPATAWSVVGYGTPTALKSLPGSGDPVLAKKAIAIDASGNLYFAGLAFDGHSDNFLTVKYDSSGLLQWRVIADGDIRLDDHAYALAIDGAGNVYVAGQSSTGIGNDFLTVKYGPNGNELWRAGANTSAQYVYDSRAYALALDAAGNVYVTGAQSPGASFDYLTIKYNSAGVEQWRATADGLGHGDDAALAIAADSLGNVIVVGHGFNGSSADYLTIKYNSSGQETWRATARGAQTGDYSPTALALDAAGNIYITGYGGNGTATDCLTVAYNPGGTERWRAACNDVSTSAAKMYALAVDGSGNVFCAGQGTAGGQGDFLTIKYDFAGAQVWRAAADGAGHGDDTAYALSMDGAGDVYVSGQSWNGTDSDYLTVKYSPAGTELGRMSVDGPPGAEDAAYSSAADGAGHLWVVGDSELSPDVTYVAVKYNTDGSEAWRQVDELVGPVAILGSAYEVSSNRPLATDAFGNVYVTGGSLEGFLTIKYDSNGTEQWRAEEANKGFAAAIAIDNAHNLYVAGTGANSIPGGTAFHTIKYDASGQKAWEALVDDGYLRNDNAAALAVDAFGSAYVSGTAGPQVVDGSTAYLTVKYDAAGFEQWRALTPTGSVYASLTAQTVDPNGNVIVTGAVPFGSNSWDCLTVAYGPTGVERWRATCLDALNAWPVPVGIKSDASGNVYVAAQSQFLVQPGAYRSEFLIIKYDSNGSELWRGRYRISLIDAFDLALDGSGNVYLTGRLDEADVNRTRYLTVKFSSSGVAQWATWSDYLIRYEDYGHAIAVDSGGSVYVTGAVYDFPNNKTKQLTFKYDTNGFEQWHVMNSVPVKTDPRFAYSVGLASDSSVYVATQSDEPTAASGILVQKIIEVAPIAFTSTLNPAFVSQAVTLTAVVGSPTPAGVVNFMEGIDRVAGCVPPVPVVNGRVSCTTSTLAAGAHALSAIYTDNAGQVSASSYLTQVVNAGMFLASSANPSPPGQSVTFTSTVGGNAPRGGTVTFLDGPSSICKGVALGAFTTTSGSASCSTSTLAPGKHSITAKYSGDARNAAFTSQPIVQIITPPTTTTVLASSANPSSVGQTITFTANITGASPTGTIDFRDAGAPICLGATVVRLGRTRVGATCATSSLSVGTHSVVATYSGDSNNAASTSNTVSEVVFRGRPSTTTLTSSLNPSRIGQAVTLAASVTGQSPIGAINFLDSGQTIPGCAAVALSLSRATCTTSTLAGGTHSITAAYSGDANNAPGTSNVVNQSVKKH